MNFRRQQPLFGGFGLRRGSAEEKFAEHFGNIQYKTDQCVSEKILDRRLLFDLPICIRFIHFRPEHKCKQQVEYARSAVLIDDDERRRSAFQRLRVVGFDRVLLFDEFDLPHTRKFFEGDPARNLYDCIPKRVDDAVQKSRQQRAAVQTFHDRIDVSGAIAVIVARQVRLIHVVDELNERFIFRAALSVIDLDREDIADRLFDRGAHGRALLNEAVEFIHEERERFFQPLYGDRSPARHIHINVSVGILPCSRLFGDRGVGRLALHARDKRIDQIVDRAAHAEQGQQCAQSRFDPALLYRVEQAVDQAGAEIYDHVFRKPELRLFCIFGQIFDRPLRLIRLYVGDVVEIRDGVDIRLDDALLADVFARKGHKAHRAGIGDRGARLDVVERVARFRRHGRDVVRVHVAGENIVDARIRKRRRNVPIVVDEVIAEEFLLHVEMLDEPVVHHADDSVALCLGGGRLFDHPRLQLGADLAARLVLRRALVGVVRAVAAAVYDDDRVPFRRLCDVGEHARLVAVLRLRIGGGFELRDDAVLRIVHGVCIRLEEQFGRGARRGDLNAVLRVVVVRQVVVYVVIAVGDVNFDVGKLRFEFRELLRDVSVRFEFPILGQISRDHEHVGLPLGDFREHPLENALALGKDLAVAVECILIICRVLDQVGREYVNVGQDRDVQRLFARLRCLLRVRLCPLRQQPDEQGGDQQQRKKRCECSLCFVCHKILR